MSGMKSKTIILLFGFAMISALAVFLLMYQGSPGPLSTSHTAVVRGSTIFSCKKCHAKEGLTAGCLSCHAEIAGQLATDTGYHTFLLKDQPHDCEACHTEHLGEEFPLISSISWTDESTNTFSHPHVEFTLTGKHDELACKKCHVEKLTHPFTLPDFPDHPRPSTMLGLEQDCIACHEDVHKSGEQTRNCMTCHDQNAFKPASHFNHDTYFVLEGVHAKAACSACHQMESAALNVNEDSLIFGPVKGKACADCHESPHRFKIEPPQDCQTCHLGTDETWALGERGVDSKWHAAFGFPLDPPHADRDCKLCHRPELPYVERYPDPATLGYLRRPDQCQGCHADPHDGQFVSTYPACLDCHVKGHFVPSNIVPEKHSKTYPLQGAHQAVACVQCHTVDPATDVRQFVNSPTACKDCHEDPHKAQFSRILDGACTACHLSDSSTFRIQTYQHRNPTDFFDGKEHRQAACQTCHTRDPEEGIIRYQAAPTACAQCHSDIHRGQFRLHGTIDCSRCHSTTEAWSAENFVHDRDAQFSLKGAHAQVECKACHQPVPQRDGKSVVQYRPLTTRCEDCHGFTAP